MEMEPFHAYVRNESLSRLKKKVEVATITATALETSSITSRDGIPLQEQVMTTRQPMEVKVAGEAAVVV
jgi:hypothetical protein